MLEPWYFIKRKSLSGAIPENIWYSRIPGDIFIHYYFLNAGKKQFLDPASPDRLVLPELASPARSTTSTSMTDVHSSSTSLSTAEERTDEDYVLTAEISSWELFDMIGPVSAMTTEGLNTESDAKRLMLEAGCLLQKTGHVLSMGDEVRGNKVNALYDKKKLQRIRPVDVFDMAVVDSMMDDAFDIKGLQDVTTALAIKNASALCTEASAVLEGKIGSNTLRLFAMCEAMADMLILIDTFKKIGDLLPYKSGEVVDVAYLAFKVFLMAVSMVVEFATVKIEQGSSRSRRDEEIEPLHHALRHVLSQMSAEDDMTWKMPGSTVEPPNYSECGMHEPYTPNYSECGAPNYSDSESADADAKADLTLPKNDGATTADGAAVTVSDTTITVGAQGRLRHMHVLEAGTGRLRGQRLRLRDRSGGPGVRRQPEPPRGRLPQRPTRPRLGHGGPDGGRGGA